MMRGEERKKERKEHVRFQAFPTSFPYGEFCPLVETRCQCTQYARFSYSHTFLSWKGSTLEKNYSIPLVPNSIRHC